MGGTPRAGPDGIVDPPPAPEEAAGTVPHGFGLVDATISSPGGVGVELSLWFAGTPDQRRRGLTGVTDLGGADGMLFRFDTAGSHRFHMWRTDIPLDILFFDEQGRYVGGDGMEPCPHVDRGRCERYSPDGPLLSAVEVPAGALDEHRIDGAWSIAYRSPLGEG